MDKRTLLALVLTAIVIVLTPRLFSHPTPSPADSTAARARVATGSTSAVSGPQRAAADSTTTRTAATALHAPVSVPTAAPAIVPETSAVVESGTRFELSSLGASVAAVRLPDSSFKSMRPGERGRGAQLAAEGSGRLVRLALLVGRDTVSLDTIAFTTTESPAGVTYTSARPAITIRYTPGPTPYTLHVAGTVQGVANAQALIVDMPSGIRSQEADTLDDVRHFAFGFKVDSQDVSSVLFTKLDTGRVRVDSGPMRWVAMRTKYFLVAALAPSGTRGFSELRTRGAPPVNKMQPNAFASAILPLQNGAFSLDLYAGPQSFEGLRRVGHDLENVNPYAGFFHGIVQPFAAIVMKILLWMKRTLNVSYGWILILFAVAIRLILWPLNQSAMRNSIKMQALQPDLQAAQNRFKGNPEAQRQAVMQVYKDHDTSPFAPMLGCLPMLLPMPVLFALYYVFSNTIEFRGVSFLWLPDLSLQDPYFITPLVMGLAMFAMSWIGMRNLPPNPQTRMMSYVMPVMMTAIFLRFASGLNLYYATQNLVSLPQQWLIARERARATSRGGAVRVVDGPGSPRRR